MTPFQEVINLITLMPRRDFRKRKNNTRSRDPHYSKGNSKVLKLFTDNPEKSFTVKEVLKSFEISNTRKAKKIKDELKKLAKNGQLVKAREVYKLKRDDDYVSGQISFTKSGRAFVMPDDPNMEEIVIGNGKTGKALNRDHVLVSILESNSDRIQGKVEKVTKRYQDYYVGELQLQTSYAFMIPDANQPVDFYIPDIDFSVVKEGMRAVVKLTKWNETKSPYGEIVELLGMSGEHEVEMNAILYDAGFSPKFEENIDKEANAIPAEITEDEIAKRLDMREITTFTIDPVDAKDFDDALSLRRLDNGNWEVGVHIADVTHYLRPGTDLDEEAYSRSTSVYLVDRTCPMLPERLSNGLCSLRPQEEKLCFSAIFELDNDAKVVKESFEKTVIYSDRRFTYEEAQERIESNEGDFADEINILNRLAKKLRARKFKNGAIAFETIELRFRLDEDKRPVEVIPKIRKEAHMLIEDFMLLANKKVAAYLTDKINNKPSVYRIHDEPNIDKLEDLRKVAERFGYKLNFRNPQEIASSLNKLTKEVHGKPEQTILENMSIRCMSKAKYSTENIGHYGLGFEFYTHFTSPIRRYSDVFVHRLLEERIKNKKIYNIKELEAKCIHISAQEKKAAEAERMSIKFKQLEYLEQYKGQTFEGIVVGFTDWGFFVEIEENKCEGFVSLESLKDDHYYYDEENLRVRGKKFGEEFRFGDRVIVKVGDVDWDRRRIDLEFIELKDE